MHFKENITDRNCTICPSFMILLYSGAVIYGLYDLTNNVDELNNVQPANRTIVDAEVISGDGSDSWAIQVNFSIPPAYYHHRLPSVNETHVETETLITS
jgi:hypothetical protein